MKTGLFFGSFNPVHIGHMAIANYMVEFTDLSQVWFVVSPHNPFKEKISLLAGHHRLEMVERAIGDDGRFRATDIEFRMPKPSYTIDTLTYLSEKHPRNKFVLILGSDGLASFKKWKNAETIIKHYPMYIYPRPGFSVKAEDHPGIRLVDAPLIEISASFIRKAVCQGRDVSHFLPPKVWEYIEEMNFYK